MDIEQTITELQQANSELLNLYYCTWDEKLKDELQLLISAINNKLNQISTIYFCEIDPKLEKRRLEARKKYLKNMLTPQFYFWDEEFDLHASQRLKEPNLYQQELEQIDIQLDLIQQRIKEDELKR